MEEPTESNCSDEETEQNLKPSSASFKSSGVHTENKPKQQSSLITKTYSFRRMLSFRSSLRGGRSNGGRSHNSSFEDSTLGFSSASPGLQPHHRYDINKVSWEIGRSRACDAHFAVCHAPLRPTFTQP